MKKSGFGPSKFKLLLVVCPMILSLKGPAVNPKFIVGSRFIKTFNVESHSLIFQGEGDFLSHLGERREHNRHPLGNRVKGFRANNTTVVALSFEIEVHCCRLMAQIMQEKLLEDLLQLVVYLVINGFYHSVCVYIYNIFNKIKLLCMKYSTRPTSCTSSTGLTLCSLT